FQQVFRQAREAGFIAVAHAGEEGPALNIRNAIDLLGVQRVDHGVRCVEDAALVQELKQTRMPLTVCPLSNLKLKVFTEMEQHNIVELLRQGLCVTINSDDPAYFGGYMTDNFMAVAKAHPMSHQELAQFTLNAIEASFISDAENAHMNAKVYEVLARFSERHALTTPETQMLRPAQLFLFISRLAGMAVRPWCQQPSTKPRHKQAK